MQTINYQLQIKQWLIYAKILHQQAAGAQGQAGLLIRVLNFTNATGITYTQTKTTS